jgi:hypothetical protein
MLNVNTLPNRKEWRNLLRLMLRSIDRKNRKKEELIFKTNALVPKKGRIKKRRGRHGTYLFSAGWRDCRSSAVRQFLQRKSKPLGNTHKIPFISDYRVVASTKFSDIWLTLQNRWNNNLNKDAEWVWESRLKTHNCKNCNVK